MILPHYSEFLTIHHLFLTTVELFTALNHQLYDNTYH
uniref:Uncharacterized protein n=1 Tax=Heterorhabditis bacteriophora TaxID=37862 RepID=A0A1I7WFE4_HETBA